MKSECCHQHPDNGSDLALQTQAQREETDLRTVNAKLLEELEWFSNRFHTNAEVAKAWAGSCSMSTAEWQDWETRARAALEEARK